MSLSFASPAFAQFIAQLSSEQKQELQALILRLQAVGDAARLSESERERLLHYAQAFAGESERQEHDAASQYDPVQAQTARDLTPQDQAPTIPSTQFLRTPFVALVRETLNAELCAHGGGFADAISYAFHNKWLPDQWKEPTFCEQLFSKYKMEIENQNAWRAEIEAVHKLNEDKCLAVGLAWFNTIYRLQQLLDNGIDLDRS